MEDEQKQGELINRDDQENGFNIEEELKKLPDRPGVYLMHGEKDEVIYVGKAVVLKNRVRQYFQSSRNKTSKILKMVSQITRFEYIVTDSELEALVLECNLIKEHQPKYNTMLKDGKSYPYICVTTSEPFPRIFSTRKQQVNRDKNRYFGPYTSGLAVKDTLELLHKVYRIRTCSLKLPKERPDRPCLNYHMKLCDGPCQGNVSMEEYRARIDQAIQVLSGHYDPLMNELKAKMNAASEECDFETAIVIRDQIESLSYIATQHQKITDYSDEDRDIIAIAKEELTDEALMQEDLNLEELQADAVASVFFVREGRMIGREHFHLQVAAGDSKETVMTSFVKQFYAGTPYIPHEIFLECSLLEEEAEGIRQWLSGKRGKGVNFVIPQKGKKERMVLMAANNAAIVLQQDRDKLKRETQRTIGAMHELCGAVGISGIRRVESYDISHISGFLSVASMIVFEDGKPKKNDYRKFRLRTVTGPDDYASMKEVLTRRLTHGLREIEEEKDRHDEAFSRFPDIILMDGGRGQVNVAEEVIASLGLHIPVCGMVKDDHHRTRGLFFHNQEVPIDHHSELFHMLTRIQDEVHRFAIEYHRSLRSKESVHSVLDDIPGIGPKRRRALMQTFESLEAIRDASVEQLAQAEGMNMAAAEAVYEFFHAPRTGEE